MGNATIYVPSDDTKSYGLSVEKYLVYLMNVISQGDISEEVLIEAMPWSKSLP